MQELLTRAGLRPGELAGETAVVTGSGRGIGREVALALGALGARVAVAELSDEGAETARLIGAAGGLALFCQTDVSSASDVARLAETVRQRFGPATILVNNAILCPVAPVSQMDLALFDRVLAVNLRGAFLTVKALLPEMEQAGHGTIINMVSTDAMPGLSAYIASKQGLTGFTQSLAAEVAGRRIRVIAFGPGMVDTAGLRAAGNSLAPLLGMKAEEFFALSLHPGYAGLMPPQHAGLATAYLVARLANEYHGESVTGYTVLERAGMLAPPTGHDGPTVFGAPASAAQSVTSVARATAQSAAAPADLLRLWGRLEAILAETAADFERLPLFVRPLARSGFKSKAGQSIQDWLRTAADLRPRLERGERPDSGTLTAQLERLIAYIQGVPAETARFTRDQALLLQVRERMAAYAADLRELVRALN